MKHVIKPYDRLHYRSLQAELKRHEQRAKSAFNEMQRGLPKEIKALFASDKESFKNALMALALGKAMRNKVTLTDVTVAEFEDQPSNKFAEKAVNDPQYLANISKQLGNYFCNFGITAKVKAFKKKDEYMPADNSVLQISFSV